MPAKKQPPTRRHGPKHYILDTNVLIHDPESPFHFNDNCVWIPVEVFGELGRFKGESSAGGVNAREVHRRLNEHFLNARNMESGVKVENGGALQVYLRPVGS